MQKINNNRVNEYIMSLEPDRLTFVMKYYLTATVLLKYELTHTISHIYPGNYLYQHHKLHHKFKKGNYSFSAIWPDKLFGTLLLEDIRSSVVESSLSEK